MSRLLSDLDPRFRPIAYELIARCCESGIAVLIVDTLRTPAEQADNIRRGVSWTTNSKHLPQPVMCPTCNLLWAPTLSVCPNDGTRLPAAGSLAIDLVPFKEFYLHGRSKLQWDPEDPAWERMGSIGKFLGLRWGGDWKQKDLGHFELIV